MAIPTLKNVLPICTVYPTLWAQGVAQPAKVQQNRSVFCTFGTWIFDSDSWIRREWRWYVNGVAVAGDDGNMPFYDVVDAIGATIHCVLTAINDAGHSTAVETEAAIVIADARTTLTAASLGFKTSQTIGSISAASKTLTVASTAGFTVNDYIIIETGGEAGRGLRGSEGVGGAWPPHSYADEAAMRADTQSSLYYAWVHSTGDVWYWDTITSAWKQDTRYYYFAKAIPRMHVAKITAIGANTFTLDTPAAVSTSNANVYFDNTRPQWAIGNRAAYDNKIIAYPAGTYVFSNYLAEVKFGAGFVSTVATGLTIQGVGRDQTFFKAPNGGCAQWNFVGGDSTNDCHFRDLTFLGSCTSHEKYAFHAHRMLSSLVLPNSSGDGIVLSCPYSTARRVTFKNCFRSFTVSRQPYCFAADCRVESAGLEMYVQWQYQWADTSFGGAWRCVADCGAIEPCFEPFRSMSIYFVDCSARNGQAAINTSGDVLFDNLQLTYEEGAGVTPAARSKYSLSGDWFFNINANIDQSSALIKAPCWVRNPFFVQQGTPYGPSDKTPAKGIAGNHGFVRATGDAAVLISGCYPKVPVGLLEAPGYASDFVGIHSNLGLVVRGVRVKGSGPASPNSQNANISIYGTTGSAGLVANCVADTIYTVSKARKANNLTNAEYESM
jgi:hypothetical protein